MNEHNAEQQALINKMDADKLRMQTNLQDRLKRRREDKLKDKSQDLKQQESERRRELDQKQRNAVDQSKSHEVLHARHLTDGFNTCLMFFYYVTVMNLCDEHMKLYNWSFVWLRSQLLATRKCFCVNNRTWCYAVFLNLNSAN